MSKTKFLSKSLAKGCGLSGNFMREETILQVSEHKLFFFSKFIYILQSNYMKLNYFTLSYF